MSFKPRGMQAAWWKTRDGDNADDLLLVGPMGASLRRHLFLCVCMCMPLPVHATKPVSFLLLMFSSCRTGTLTDLY